MIKEYLWLTKPGIIAGNSLTAIGAFILASKGNFDFLLFFAMLVGLSCVIGSACVFNNYIDRDIDLLMARTSKRALASRSMPVMHAMIFALVLSLIGFSSLWFFTNTLTTIIALIGFLVYVFFYTPMKRLSVHGTLVGSISGATPPLIGYCAVTNQMDLGAWLLFVVLAIWQMPHFYSIAIYRLDDYARAGIPVMAVKKGIRATKLNIIFYVIAFIVVTSLLTVYGYTGYFYLSVMGIAGLIWLARGIRGLRKGIDDRLWAKKMFKFSLIVLLLFSIMISFDGV